MVAPVKVLVLFGLLLFIKVEMRLSFDLVISTLRDANRAADIRSFKRKTTIR